MRTEAEIIIGRIYYWGAYAVLLIFIALFSLRNHKKELLVALVLISLLCLYQYRVSSGEKPGYSCQIKRLDYVMAFLLLFVSRTCYCLYMNSYIHQGSDFAVLLQEAASAQFTDHLEYYRQYAHKIYYPLLLHTLGIRTQTSILIFQAALIGLTAVCILYLVQRFWSGHASRYAVVLYLLWPGQWVYSTVITEEHLAALMTLIIAIGMLVILDPENGHGRSHLCYALWIVVTGLACGVISLLKDWGIVFLVATIICSIWQLVRLTSHRLRLQMLAGIVVILIIRSGISNAMLSNASNILGVPAVNNVLVEQMFATLVPDSHLGYNVEGNEEYYALAEENDYDYDEANRQAMAILRERIVKGIDRMPQLLLKKGTDAYGDDSSMLYWAFKAQDIRYVESQPTPRYMTVMWNIAAVYYVFILVSVLVGGVIGKPDIRRCLFMAVCIGGICVSLLVESHGRYKYSIEPIWCILAAVNLDRLLSRMRKWRSTTNK